MEVFMRHLPQHLTGDALAVQLDPLLARLGIRDFACQKSPKKTFGHVTFLRLADALAFLTRYGGPRSRLAVLGRDVMCSKSSRQPSQLALRHLQQRADERAREREKEARAKKEAESEENPGGVLTLPLVALDCGHNAFVGGRMVFCADWTARHDELDAGGVIRFGRRLLVVELRRRRVRLRIRLRIRYSTIVEMVRSHDDALLLTLCSLAYEPWI
ncbi:hypothetical protein VTK73DRAFT_5309 [Phialemonium thermophilum]|uniref:Uncharacterized protein n=1 Tax=Phialemonium thermophilum TaxID=223376 RepID=A0ABR3V347_9PEZI